MSVRSKNALAPVGQAQHIQRHLGSQTQGASKLQTETLSEFSERSGCQMENVAEHFGNRHGIFIFTSFTSEIKKRLSHFIGRMQQFGKGIEFFPRKDGPQFE